MGAHRELLRTRGEMAALLRKRTAGEPEEDETSITAGLDSGALD